MGFDLSKGGLVKEAEAILNQERVRGSGKFKHATAQLRNLVQIVQTEWDVKVLENFLNYQRGRKATADFWALIHEDVVRVLRDIDRAAGTDDGKRKAAVQGFFGFLVRHYVYLDKINDESRPPRGPDRSQGADRRPAVGGGRR